MSTPAEQLPRHAGSVLLFGAAGAVGTEVARVCGEAGISVIPVFHQEPPAAIGGAFSADIADRSAVDSVCASASADGNGAIIGIINCSGVGFFAPLTGDYAAQWETMYRVNTLGLANLISVAALRWPRLEHFIHVNSLAAYRLPSDEANAVYASSKSACRPLLAQFRKSQRARGSCTKITSISPGFIRGARFADRYFAFSPERRAELYDRFEPLEAADVAEVILAVLRLPARIEVSELIVRPRQQPD